MNLGNGFPVPRESGSIHPSDHWMILRNAEKAVTRNIIGGVPNADPRVLRNEGIYIGDPRTPITEEMPVMRTSIPAVDEMQRSMVNHYGMLGLQGRISEERPVVQTNYPMPDEVDGGSWRDLLIFGSEVSQVTPTDEALHEFDHDISVNGGYYQNLMKGVHGTGSRTVPATDRLSLASSYHATGNECLEFQSAKSILPEQMQALSASQGIITSNLLQKTAIDGTPIQQKNAYNLNSSPGSESAIDSCAANRFEFAPETPDQEKQLISHQLSDSQSFSAEESLPPKIDEGIICTSSQGENPLDVLSGNAAELPASNATALKEHNEGDRGVIDLNKTPVPSASRRRKHRPKVVVEGKKKKAPKPPVEGKPKRAPKTKNPDEKTPGKRKYVRRKGIETSVSKPGKESSGVETSAPNSANKLVRRGLNFELEARINDESDKMIVADQQHPNLRPFDLNLESQDTEWSKELHGVPDISEAVQRPQIACGAVQQCKSVLNLEGDSQKFCETLSPPSHRVSTATVRDHNFNVLARSLQTASIGDKSSQFCVNQGHQPLNGEGKGKVPVQANFSFSSVGVAQPLLVQTSTTVLKDVAAGKDKEGPKRSHWQTSRRANCHPADLMPSQVFHHEMLRTVEQDTCGDRTGIAASDSNKRKKFDNTCHGLAYNMPSYVAYVEDSSRPLELKGGKMSHSSSSSSCTYSRLPNFNHGMQSTLSNNNSGSNGLLADCGTFTATLGNSYEDPQNLTWLQYHRLAMLKNYLQGAEALNLNVTTGITDYKVSPSQGVPAPIQGNGIVTPVDLSLKSRRPASIIQPSLPKLHLNDHREQLVCQNSSKKAKEPKPGQNYAVNDTINEIISRLEGLAISDKRQNALVPYKGDGEVVPYVGFDPIKRSKPRPRVDLDPETNRLWNLLMGKTASESEETMDSDKEKWWEDERKFVHGRVNAFITRMHQFQGDRRFSPWKGSVLDSVIGVFLTQNVSDHLSSSAFISLVAKFPSPLRKSRPTCSEYESISWVEEPDVQIIDQDGTITYHGRKVMQPHKKQNPVTLNGSSEGRPGLLNWETVTHCTNENNSGREEDVISSQNSSESFCQSAKYMRSSPESEVEDHVTVFNSKKNNLFEGAQKTEEFTSLQQFHSQMMIGMLNDKSSMSGYEQPSTSIFPTIRSGSNEHSYPVNSDFCCLQGSSFPSSCFCLNKTSDMGVNGSCCSALSEHSFFSTSAEIKKGRDAALTSNMKGGATRSASYSTSTETEIPFNHVRRMDPRQCSNQLRDNLQPGSHFVSSQESVSSSQVQTSSSFHQEGKSPAEPARLEQAAAKETGSSSEPLNNNTGTDNTPNAKRKRNVNKAKEFDWDSLRRKVLSESGKKERGPENMDTLDYEDLRNADVRVISRTILERGMNNMLAERIKDFLNRLVRDHGSTDLEWLREVPPEQAKDYLLSIRGLGLKSVECVRLLTLHQVAFPVDTNVGRIAVRLGWVPLQPLPESLQLHLLELYPILESIQKYLWPRLCKLDQRTLYELHYQLITFGKVFCTKKKPNCNACPMRPECRHFASAFASARLALPAPEEKGMVNSTAPMATSDIPSSFVEPMLLLPACFNTMGSELQFSGGPCEPIIEEPLSPEPASPEPAPEISESDIEDLFYEDPDDYIPTINLNFEEFKTNVENVMRGQNMGIQLGDLSKALVALDASTASIPVPKLKNVSRLRTEHLVYELPDSHPLLREMERREPDDPSPYLLAIWGPGETGDSTHPPEECSHVHENENNSETVRGTLLIPCRTAMRGSFPLNGTYFQVNEMFADHESSKIPIYVPREWLWKLPRRTVYFGTSVTSIFRGLTQTGIQFCFWRGFVCVRGFDRNQRTPKPLERRLHEIASKVAKNKDNKEQKNKDNNEQNNKANKERENKENKERKNKENKERKNKEKKERKKGKGEESNRVK